MDMKFIESELTEIDTEKRQPASYVRKSFTSGKPVKNAVLYITALGNYIGYINGRRLDEL